MFVDDLLVVFTNVQSLRDFRFGVLCVRANAVNAVGIKCL